MGFEYEDLENLLLDLRVKQDTINRALDVFSSDLEAVKKVNIRQDEDVDKLIKDLDDLEDLVNGTVENVLDSNMIIRTELTKYYDYMLEERREAERREEEAKVRAHEAKINTEEIKSQTRNQWFKIVGAVLTSNVLMYVAQHFLN